VTNFLHWWAWLTWWAFLGLKLSGAWTASWWTVTIPLDVVGGIYLGFVVLFAVVGAGTTIAVQKGAGKDIDNAFKRIRTR
jgi:hypothetical protein